ncbi:MAG: F0F1 ATP synthase subunit gamma [Evtepia sp.]
MAGITEIRTRIDSVQQTLKITNAMYLISSSKLRKARQQLAHVQPFYERIRETIADILHRSPMRCSTSTLISERKWQSTTSRLHCHQR